MQTAAWPASQMQPLSALALDTQMGVLTFCVSRQIQQLDQRIDVCFTIHEDQALHAIGGIFRIQHEHMHWRLFHWLFLHDLHPTDSQ